MNTTITTKTVEELHAAELALSDQLTQARSELVAARDRDAEEVLHAAFGENDGRAVGANASMLAGHVQEKETAIATAIEHLRERRLDAIRAEWAAEAAELRNRANARNAEAASHEKRTNELLAKVREHEQCDFVPAYRLTLAVLNASAGVATDALPIEAVPLSEQMRFEASALVRQADLIGRRELPINGQISATTRDELLATVRGWDARKIAPALHLVAAWFDAYEVVAREKVERLPDDDARLNSVVTYTIVWHNGHINDGKSRAEIQIRERNGVFLGHSVPMLIDRPKAPRLVNLDAYRNAEGRLA